MSIQSEIDRIKAGKADAKAALIERGVDPGDATIDEYGNQIRAIPTGVTSFKGRTGAVTPQSGDYTAEMVGARPSTWTPSAADVGAVPVTRTVNGQALSGDIALDAADVGALPISGGTLTGQLDCGGRLLRGVANPTAGQDAVNLQYAQTNFAPKDSFGGAGKRTCRFVVGTSTAGWTEDDCDYLCDGTADQVEINAAIQALPSGGGEIVILDGTYNITATIAMDKDNVKLSGNGNATVLRRMWDNSADEGVITITATNGGCCVESLQVDGNKAIYTSGVSYGIYLHESNNNTITGNTCNNNNRGICLSSSSNNTITGNTCNNNSRGIYLSSSNNTITGNTYNNNNHGIYLSGSSNNTITGNTCNNNNHGIYLSGSSNNTITGNTCIRGKGTSSDYASTQYTIYLYSDNNNYNLISSNNIMGKNYVSGGGTGNTFVNNKYN